VIMIALTLRGLADNGANAGASGASNQSSL
jgi:hypothetical protein